MKRLAETCEGISLSIRSCARGNDVVNGTGLTETSQKQSAFDAEELFRTVSRDNHRGAGAVPNNDAE